GGTFAGWRRDVADHRVHTAVGRIDQVLLVAIFEPDGQARRVIDMAQCLWRVLVHTFPTLATRVNGFTEQVSISIALATALDRLAMQFEPLQSIEATMRD